MTERRQRLRLGLFVAFTLVALGGLIVFFGGSPDFLQKRNTYTVLFPDAPGVTVGTPVRRSGVRVGEVGALELDDRTGLVRVTLRIDPKFTPRAREQVTISRNLIGADSSIDFVPGTADERPPDLGEPIPVGTELVGVPPPSPRTLLTQTQELLPNAQESLEAIRRSVQRFEKIAPRVEETLDTFKELVRSVDEFVPEVRGTNDEIRSFVGTAKGLGPEVRKTNDELRVLLAQGNNIVEELRTTIKVNEPEVMRAVKNISEASSLIGRAFNDQNQQQLTETLRSLNGASRRIESLSITADDVLREVRKMVPSVQATITQIEAVVRDVKVTTNAVAARADRITANVEVTSELVKCITGDVREVIRAVARADGSVQRLLGDPALYENVNSIVGGVNRLIPKLDRILADVEVFADKIARHPESIGVGGAVRPSAGLKDSPVRPR